MGWNNYETLQTASVLLKLLLGLSHLYRKFVTTATFRECARYNRARSSLWQPSSKYELSRKTNKKECIIALLNVNSLPSKLIETREWFVKGVFAILCIEETKNDSTSQNWHNFQLHENGYNILNSGGGVMIFVSDSTPAIPIKIVCKFVEAILLD